MKVKSCGKAHPYCAICRPDIAAANLLRPLGGAPLATYLVVGGPTPSKRRLFREGVLVERCICGQGPTWHGQRLVLQLDHINGDRTDNRLENLRILCPNCHSQTLTFTGRNHGRYLTETL